MVHFVGLVSVIFIAHNSPLRSKGGRKNAFSRDANGILN